MGRGIAKETLIGLLDIFLQAGLDINAPYDPITSYQPHVMSSLDWEDPERSLVLKWFAEHGQKPDIIVNGKGQTLRDVIEKKKKLMSIFQPYWG